MKVKDIYIHPDMRDYDTQDIIPPIQIFLSFILSLFFEEKNV